MNTVQDDRIKSEGNQQSVWRRMVPRSTEPHQLGNISTTTSFRGKASVTIARNNDSRKATRIQRTSFLFGRGSHAPLERLWWKGLRSGKVLIPPLSVSAATSKAEYETSPQLSKVHDGRKPTDRATDFFMQPGHRPESRSKLVLRLSTGLYEEFVVLGLLCSPTCFPPAARCVGPGEGFQQKLTDFRGFTLDFLPSGHSMRGYGGF